MSENKLTKTAIKNELNRRINWFEASYGFNIESGKPYDKSLHIQFGRYCTLTEMRWQIENNLFIGGYTC